VYSADWFIYYLVCCKGPFEMLVIFTTTINVINKYKAIRIVIIPFGCLYNFLVIVIISSVIITSYLEFSFLFKFAQFSIIIILGITKRVIISTELCDPFSCFKMLPTQSENLHQCFQKWELGPLGGHKNVTQATEKLSINKGIELILLRRSEYKEC
jgi:hypothetical protein